MMTGIIARAVAAVAAACVSCAALGGGISIVLPSQPTGSERFAAKELKYHLEKATGEDVAIVAEDSAPATGRRMFIGNTKALAAIGVEYGKFGEEERLVKGVGGDIYLAGGEMPNLDAICATAQGQAARGLAGGGTLYAAYDFLEREMGVKWIWPGELGEVIPHRAVPSMDGVERRGVEPLLQRNLRGDLETMRRITIANRLWGWKDRANARREVEARRLWLTRNRVGRRQNIGFGHAFTDWYARYKDHPEYFAMQPSGVRGHFASGDADGDMYYPLCVSNPKVHDAIVADWVRNCGGRFRPDVPPPSVNCCENDSPGFCVCPECRAWDAADGRFATHPYWNGTIRDVHQRNRFIMCRQQWGEDGVAVPNTEPPSVSDRYVKFYNAVLDKARKIHPLALVSAYAYANYTQPPVETRVADGLVLSFVPAVVFPYDDSASDVYRRRWAGWNAMGARKMWYRPNYMFAGANLPYSMARRVADDINFAYAHGMIAIDQDSMLGAWSAQAMKNYVIARIMREPDATYDKMSAEFLSAFGTGAEEIRRYCEMLEALNDRFSAEEWREVGRNNPSKGGSPGGSWCNFFLAAADLYSEEWFAEADALLAAAEGKTSGVEAARVAFLRKGLRDGLLTYRTRVAQKSGDKAAFSAAFKNLVAYRASVEGDLICAFAWFADSEENQAGWPHKTQRYCEFPAARGVLSRFAGAKAAEKFLFERMDATEPQAVVSSKYGKILVKATDENRAAAAVGRYIREVAKGHWSRCGKRVPDAWPLPKAPLRVKSVLPHMHAYNWCAFAYSFAFYGQEEWRENIDRLALSGFTSAIVPVGNMKVWQLFLRDAGFSEAQIAAFIPDETAQPWVNAGVMEGVGAPFPPKRLDEEARLGRWIAREMRALGIEPMLQGFTGLLPNSSTNVICGAKWPDARIYDQGTWAGDLKRPVLLDATTDAYSRLAKMWYRRLYEVYGISDPKFFVGNLFSEIHIDVGNLHIDCPKIAAAMQREQQIASPGATWCISCWGIAPRQDLLDGLDPDLTRIIVLDKNMANGGVFPRSFGRITWLWGELLNFGGNEGMYGGLNALVTLHWHSMGANGATLRGYALESEGVNSNPFFYDLFMDLFFRRDAVVGEGALDRWLADYALRRYGVSDVRIEKALSLLARFLWNVDRRQEGCSECVFCARPRWNVRKASTWGSDRPLYFYTEDVEAAARLYLEVAKDNPALLDLETFRFDFTDIFREVISNRGRALAPRLNGDPEARAEFLALIRRMDALLACTDAFRLDTYEALARKRAGERGVRSLRRMFTTWIERPNSNLNDYAHHQYAGLLVNYYLKRWEAFFANPENADAALDALELSAPSADWVMPSKNGDLLKIAESEVHD